MTILPQDCDARKIESRAEAILHYRLCADRWVYHGITGTDHGTDCEIELVENNEYHNFCIKCQIKGTGTPTTINNGNHISFPLETKTINYGLCSRIAFVLFVVDTSLRIAYYLCLQDFFIENPIFFNKTNTDQKTINLHIPVTNVVNEDDDELREIAKEVYVGGPGRNLHKVT